MTAAIGFVLGFFAGEVVGLLIMIVIFAESFDNDCKRNGGKQ